MGKVYSLNAYKHNKQYIGKRENQNMSEIHDQHALDWHLHYAAVQHLNTENDSLMVESDKLAQVIHVDFKNKKKVA
jgi:hypothetical protein